MINLGSTAPVGVHAPIGVFDSGVGGLSVLRHLQTHLPQEDFLYFADSGYAPYGEKPEALIIARVEAIAAFLLERGAKALVVACNTATAASIEALRKRYPALPVVGVEPGLKPAAALSHSRKIGVLATEATLASAKFKRLQSQLETDTGVTYLLQACNGLADQIEKGELHSPATALMLRRYIAPLLAEGADTLVLGCTHYPFVLPLIEALAPAGTRIIDTGAAVAQQMGRLLAGQQQAGGSGTLNVFTSGSVSSVERACAVLLGLTPTVVAVAA
jgi:glutamate racemase